MKTCILIKIPKLDSNKTVCQFTKWPLNVFQIFLVYDTTQWLKCVIRYFNVKIDQELVDEMTYNLLVPWNESARGKVDILAWTLSYRITISRDESIASSISTIHLHTSLTAVHCKPNDLLWVTSRIIFLKIVFPLFITNNMWL